MPAMARPVQVRRSSDQYFCVIGSISWIKTRNLFIGGVYGVSRIDVNKDGMSIRYEEVMIGL